MSASRRPGGRRGLSPLADVDRVLVVVGIVVVCYVYVVNVVVVVVIVVVIIVLVTRRGEKDDFDIFEEVNATVSSENSSHISYLPS